MQSLLPPLLPNLLPPRPFYFLRHGETDWNATQRIQGRTDIPLNPNGVAQAQAAAKVLQSVTIHRIISSPLQRAAATAAVVHHTLGKPIHHDDDLVEQHYGAFEGRLRTEIAAELGDTALHNFWEYLPPDAEQRGPFTERALRRVHHHLQAYPTETLLFVGHGGFMGALAFKLGMSNNTRFANALPYQFTPTPTGWQMAPLPQALAATGS